MSNVGRSRSARMPFLSQGSVSVHRTRPLFRITKSGDSETRPNNDVVLDQIGPAKRRRLSCTAGQM